MSLNFLLYLVINATLILKFKGSSFLLGFDQALLLKQMSKALPSSIFALQQYYLCKRLDKHGSQDRIVRICDICR